MPSFCAMPSELVRQHPKRNIPPQQTSIQHMLLLALSLSCISLPGCQQSWEMCIRTLWVCAHACPRLWKKCRVLWGTDGKEHTQCDSRYAYVSRCARAYVCVCLCVREATLLERASAESDKEAQWEKILAVLSVCAETDHGGGAMPLASVHLQATCLEI